MITDQQTNRLYLSGLLKKRDPELFLKLTSLLDKKGIEYKLLLYTKDIWCRDYMPIQKEKKQFIQYLYTPDYLQNQVAINYQTDPTETLNAMNISTQKCNLIIDGGNMIKCDDTIIMIEKVFEENHSKTRDEVIQILKQTFNCEFIFLPWDREEIYGHADGAVRYIGNNQVLMTNYSDYDVEIASEIRRRLETKFKLFELEYNPSNHKENWAYINYIQTEKIIILPKLNCMEDNMALEQIEHYLPEYKGNIYQLDCSKLVKKGGALNCISWNICV